MRTGRAPTWRCDRCFQRVMGLYQDNDDAEQ
jgi:hypothetical protein